MEPGSIASGSVVILGALDVMLDDMLDAIDEVLVQRVFEQDGWIELDEAPETEVGLDEIGAPVEAERWLLTGGLVWGAEATELGGGGGTLDVGVDGGAACEVAGGGGGAFEVGGGGGGAAALVFGGSAGLSVFGGSAGLSVFPVSGFLVGFAGFFALFTFPLAAGGAAPPAGAAPSAAGVVARTVGSSGLPVLQSHLS
jgi:hypothetical protein